MFKLFSIFSAIALGTFLIIMLILVAACMSLVSPGLSLLTLALTPISFIVVISMYREMNYDYSI